MATSEFLKIASFATAAEADQIRTVLAEHGIVAFVDGANTSTALSYVGSGLGGVRVLVPTADAARAREVIDSLSDESDLSAEAWFCGECQEEVDGGFQICWSCGKERSEVEQPFPESDDEENESAREQHGAANVEADHDDDYDRLNPYVAPQSAADMTRPEEQDVEINPEAEAMLLRAWRASIIGLVFFPFIAHLYSMYLLLYASTLATTFSSEGRKRFNRALVINILAGCLIGMILGRMFMQ